MANIRCPLESQMYTRKIGLLPVVILQIIQWVHFMAHGNG
jgi:hypothetical protein